MPAHSIQVDDEVWAAVVGRINGFDLTPNEILRQVFGITSPSRTLSLAEPEGATPGVRTDQTLSDFVKYEQFQQLDRAVDRFLVLLGWLSLKHPRQFLPVALSFKGRKRCYFALSRKDILKSGKSIGVRRIPHTPYWALITLDNKSKRQVIEHILRTMRYSSAEISSALAEFSRPQIQNNGNHLPQLESRGA